MKAIYKLLVAGGVVAATAGFDNRLEITHYEVQSKKIPKEFDGFKIIHVSDFHCDNIPELAGVVSELQPDIIVSTGDMVNDKGSFMPAIKLTKQLADIAPLYMVTGNHDVWRADYKAFIDESSKMGGHYLHCDSIEVERCGEKIVISGIDDPFSRANTVIYNHIKDSLEKINKSDKFHILLYHRANLLDEFKCNGFDLILAGHMHGGQFRIPGIGGVISPKTSFASEKKILFPHYFGGIYTAGDTTMIVSRGLGNPTILPRIYNRPELVCIKLKHI